MSIWASSSLCEEEIEELKIKTVFTIAEIESLYERFKYLDRSSSGFLTFVEFQMIPEFYSNPFCSLIINHLESLKGYEKISFASYLEFLSIFNRKTQTSKRISFLFSIFDIDKERKITRNSLMEIHRLMRFNKAESSATEADDSVNEVLRYFDRNNKGFLSFSDFENFYNSDPTLDRNMILDTTTLMYPNRSVVDFMKTLWRNK